MITIEIPKEIVIKVQRADIEQSARKEIIAYILEKNLDISSERFEQYQKEYDDKFFAFEQAKQEVEQTYVLPTIKNPKHWTLEYNSGLLTIEE